MTCKDIRPAVFSPQIEPADLDQAVRDRLADSLQYIFDQCGKQLCCEPGAYRRTLTRIRTDRVGAGVFARYFDLVFSIDRENWSLATQLVDEIDSIAGQTVGFDVLPYNPVVLGDDYDRFPRLAFASYSDENPLSSPGSELFDSHRQKINQALDIIDAIDADIYREIISLLSSVIIAIRNPDSKRSFGGVTSLMLWGSSIVNAQVYASLPQIVDYLVHEITHSMLFGHHVSAPLVMNDPDESYVSPLRADPRPMDGVYHATVVSARLALFAQKCLDNAVADNDLRLWAQAAIHRSREAFAGGLSVIDESATLSGEGRDILERARAGIVACDS